MSMATQAASRLPAATMTAEAMARKLTMSERDAYFAGLKVKALEVANDHLRITIEELAVELEATRVRLEDRERELAAQAPLLSGYRAAARLTRALCQSISTWQLNPAIEPMPVISAIREYLNRLDAMEGRVTVRRDGGGAARPSGLLGCEAGGGTGEGEPAVATDTGGPSR